MEPTPLVTLEPLASQAVTYANPLFKMFSPFLKYILGFFIGYFILSYIVDVLLAVKERKVEELDSERDLTLNLIKKTVEPLFNVEFKAEMKRIQRNWELGRYKPEDLVADFKAMIKKRAQFYQYLEQAEEEYKKELKKQSKLGKLWSKAKGLVNKIFST
jgi:hypothetical protein